MSNQKKFEFLKPEVNFGGMIVSANGFKIQPRITEAIEQFPEPTSLTEMKRFHGYVNQLTPFDEQLAKKFEPLRHLLKKTPEFEMTEEDTRNFEKVKKQLVHPKSLAYFKPGRPTQVFTDAACTAGFGFVVKQLQPNNVWKPVMYGSRALNPAEKTYAPIEAEMAALAWALNKAKIFLYGGPRFTLYTDHKPLVGLVNKKRYDEVLNPRLLGSLLKCEGFTFEVQYIKGGDNLIADCLSRGPVSKPNASDNENAELARKHIRVIQNANEKDADYSPKLQKLQRIATEDAEYQILKTTITTGFPEQKSNLDPAIHAYWSVRQDLTVLDSLILYGVRLVIPRKMRKDVLEEVHAAHRGIELTKARARLIVYWPGMDAQIEQLCKSCEKCIIDRPSQRDEPQKHYETPSRAFEVISADFACVDNVKYLILTDWKTGWFSTRQMRKTDAAATIHQLRDFFSETAVPNTVFTDNGPPFTSAEFRSFLDRWGIEGKTSSPYYPRSNTFAENGVKDAKSLLKKCITNGKMNYDEWCKGLLCLRNTPHKTTGLSPAVMLYGHSVNDCAPAHKTSLDKSWHKELSDVDKKIAKQRQNQEFYRPGRPLPELKVGNPVVIQNRNNKKWDKYGIIQERNLKLRRYTVRLPSGMLTMRNRIDLRRRFPKQGEGSGTSEWTPFRNNQSDHQDDDSDDEDSDSESDSDKDDDVVNNHNVGGGDKPENENVQPVHADSDDDFANS